MDFSFLRKLSISHIQNLILHNLLQAGYVPPEMLVPRAISTKSDVYSYGMVLLELVGGRRNFESTMEGEAQKRRNTYFPKIATDMMKEGKLMEVIDKSLLNSGYVREEEVTILVRVAFWCIQENPDLRPNMNDVVDMLEGRKMVSVPPESPMFALNFLDVESNYNLSRFDGNNQDARNTGNTDATVWPAVQSLFQSSFN